MNMKTLLIYSNYDGFAVQLKNHVEDALTELAVEWKECYIEEFPQMNRQFEPIMNVFFHPNKLIYKYKQEIDQAHGHKTIWSMEDPYESDILFDLAPHFFNIFTQDKNTAIELQKTFPGRRIEYVPHAYNPKVHFPQEVSYEYRSDILFVGNAYESRLQYFREHAAEYKDRMVTIIGVGYRGLDGYQNQRIIHGHISEPEMMKYINGTQLALNLHRQNSDLDMANSRKIVPDHYNNRYYEIMATGVIQKIVGRPDTHISFDPVNDTYVKRLTKYYLPLLT